MAQLPTILIMAAGTGGHVFPALAVARVLQERGCNVVWLASQRGMENQLLEDSGIEIFQVSVKGLQGKGLVRMITAPLMLITSLMQSLSILRRVRPACVLGMGGYISGPGGVAAKLLRIPLVLHEQNAVAGYTNKRLQGAATRLLEAFPGTFPSVRKAVQTGNPLRQEITALHNNAQRNYKADRALRLLVLGGSQGAAAINRVIPALIRRWQVGSKLHVWHQVGERDLLQAREDYQRLAICEDEDIRVVPFIKDMAEAYRWADIVICRSGASTVSELAAASLPAILVPYPHHKDQQQFRNAQWLSDAGAALLLPQHQLSEDKLYESLVGITSDSDRLAAMSSAAGQLAILDADVLIADHCLEVARGC